MKTIYFDWTTERDNILATNYNHMTDKQLAELIGTTASSVHGRLIQLKLKRDVKPKFHPAAVEIVTIAIDRVGKDFGAISQVVMDIVEARIRESKKFSDESKYDDAIDKRMDQIGIYHTSSLRMLVNATLRGME